MNREGMERKEEGERVRREGEEERKRKII